MPYKRHPNDEEVAELAANLKAEWTEGEAIVPWLRANIDRFDELIKRKWTWKGIAAALTHAGISYKTGRPWTDKALQKRI